MKKCELCKSPARVLCDSDQANLCWECDARVHSANFLVAKHTRTLLCQACQSQTPWTGSGPKLGPTLSVCQACFATNSTTTTAPVDHDLENNGAEDEEEEDDDEGENGEEEDEEEEEDDDNQVVPFSSSTQLQPPSLPSTSSSSEDSSTRFYRETDPNGFLSKRTDENASSHYDGIERPDENAYQRTTRSWTWR